MAATEDENDVYLQLVNFQSIRDKQLLEYAISLDYKGVKLLLKTTLPEESIAPLFSGTEWAGTRVWHAAICMTDHLYQRRKDLKETSASLIELGCGLGVPGMLCHALLDNVSETYLTDEASLVQQLHDNIDSNNSLGKPSIAAKELDWCSTSDENWWTDKSFDIILNCDCIYEPLYGKSYEALAKVLEVMLKKNPKALCLTSVERRNADGVEIFLEILRGSSAVQKVELVWSDPDYKIEIYQAFGNVDEESAI